MRFVVQWIASEKRKRERNSHIVLVLWPWSEALSVDELKAEGPPIGRGLTLFTYVLHRLDPVFVLGE